MDTNRGFFSSLSLSREAAVLSSVGVAGNPDLAAGLLLVYSLLGLATIIGAFFYHRGKLDLFKRAIILGCTRHHRDVSAVDYVPHFLNWLLIVDTVNFITAVILGFAFAVLSSTSIHIIPYTSAVWFTARWYGIILQLLCVLVCFIYLSHPQAKATLHFLLVVSICLLIFWIPIFIYVPSLAEGIFDAVVFILTLIIIAKFTSPVAPSVTPVAHTVKKQVMVAAMCTFLIVFFPSFILQCLILNDFTKDYEIIYLTVVFFTNCPLIIDGLLCFLVLKLFAAEKEQQLQQQQQQQRQPRGVDNPGFCSSENVSTDPGKF